jgi:prepilin peptidase CpaA
MERFVAASILTQLGPLFIGLAIALWTDVSARRIPNWLTFSLAVAGLLNAALWAVPVDLGYASLGLIVGFSLMFAKFVIGATSGGDVKMMAAIGAWIGPLPVFQVFVVYHVIGIVVVLYQAISQKRLPQLLKNSMLLAANVVSVKQVGTDHVIATGQATRTLDRYMPAAVPFSLAVLFVVLMNVL